MTHTPIIEGLFLRFYAANLSRNSRNDASTACADAILQLAAMGGIASTTAYVVVGLLFAAPLLRHMYAVDWTFFVIAAGAGGAFGLWGWLKFRRYKENPGAAAPYRSRTSIRTITVLYFTVPVVWAWLIGFALRFLG
jgi:hypothetical protein